QTAIVEPSVESNPIPSRPLRIPWRTAVAVFAVLILASIIWFGVQARPAGSAAANGLPWSTMLRKNRTVKIVFSDPNIATFQQIFGYQLSLADYAAHRYVPESPALRPEAPQILKVLRGDNVAAVDAATALRIGAMVPPDRIQTFRARTLQAGDF